MNFGCWRGKTYIRPMQCLFSRGDESESSLRNLLTTKQENLYRRTPTQMHPAWQLAAAAEAAR